MPVMRPDDLAVWDASARTKPGASNHGLTKREWLIGQVVGGMGSPPWGDIEKRWHWADEAVRRADALIDAANRSCPDGSGQEEDHRVICSSANIFAECKHCRHAQPHEPLKAEGDIGLGGCTGRCSCNHAGGLLVHCQPVPAETTCDREDGI